MTGLGIVLVSFAVMEGVAWFTHKYVMHGFLWSWHQDHHRPTVGTFEKNDLFFLIFAIPSIILILFGVLKGYSISFYVGLGIAIYGLCYFLVHDVLIHRRFKWFDKTNNAYFRAIRKAHKIHHKSNQRDKGRYFGLLWIPKDLK